MIEHAWQSSKAPKPPPYRPPTYRPPPAPLWQRLIILLCVAAGIGYGWARFATTSFWPRKPFTKEAWAAAGPTGRYVFFKDLRDRRVLIGMTRAQVEDLVGEDMTKPPPGSDHLDYGLKYAGKEFEFYAYWIMTTQLDASGHVARVLAEGH